MKLTETINDWKPEVNSLLDALVAAGFTLVSGNNGEEKFKFTNRADFVADLIACDESSLYVDAPVAPDDGSPKRLWIFLVLGNAPGELVCDCTVSEALDAVLVAEADKWTGKSQPTITRTTAKEFRIVAVSSKPNSFGLFGYVLVARDGTAYEVARSLGSHHDTWTQGKDVAIRVNAKGQPFWAWHDCEIPRALPKATPSVLHELFPGEFAVAKS